MSSPDTTGKTQTTKPPISLDFGGPLGRASNEPSQRRTTRQPNLPDPPGDWSKNKPPQYPSLF